MPSPSQPAATQDPTQTQSLSAGVDMRELAKLIAGELADIVVERLAARFGKTAAPATMQSEILTADQAAQMLSVHPETIRRWCKAGKIPSTKLGGNNIQIAKAEVVKMVAEGTTSRSRSQLERAKRKLGIT